MSKRTHYAIVGRVENIGRVDGTSRDTWSAFVDLRSAISPASSRFIAQGYGTGKAPGVAASRAVTQAFDHLRRR